MKLNGGTPRHYMPLSQSQSDDEENANIKGPKFDDSLCKSVDVPQTLEKRMFKSKPQTVDPKSLPMSPLRTLAFILSLLMCVAFFVIFMWLLPCKPVVPTIDDIGNIVIKWSIVLQSIFCTTDVVLANAKSLHPVILFGYYNSSAKAENSKGIIALQKADGKILWELALYSEPTSILCDYIDVNNDTLLDCLVIGLDSLMTAIDINKGSNIWYLHNHSGIQDADNISLPVVLADCDDDSVLDIAVSYTIANDKNIAHLALVSGRTGEVIGSLIPLQQCILPITYQFSLEWLNRTIFIIFCSDGKKGNLWLTYAEDICDIALNKTENLKLTLIYRNTHFSPDVQFKTFAASNGSFVMAINGSKFLMLEPKHNGKIKVKWLKTIKTDSPWRVAAFGKYINGQNSELLLSKSSNFSSEIIGLDMQNGKQLWSTAFNGSIITSVLRIPNFFDKVDGIILKMIRPSIKNAKTDAKIMAENLLVNVTEVNYHENSKYSTDIDKLIEEGYVLFRGGNVSVTKTLSAEEISQHCYETDCKPDLFTDRKTALITTLNNGAVDMAVAFSNTSGPSNLQTSIKLLTFKHLKHSKCMYKLSS